MTSKATRLLSKIEAKDGSLRLTRANAAAASELKILGYVIYIPISTGGADVAITKSGAATLELLDQIKEKTP